MNIKDQIKQQQEFILKLQSEGATTVALAHYVWAINELSRIADIIESLIKALGVKVE